MQNFGNAWLPTIHEHARIVVPAGAAKVSFIDTRDVSAAVARLLVGDDLDNRDFDLTGARALDLAEAAAILSRASSRDIGYEDVEPQAFKAALLAAGLNSAYADFLVLILGFLEAGYNAPVTDGVRRLLDRDPISFERYAQDFSEVWRPLKAA